MHTETRIALLVLAVLVAVFVVSVLTSGAVAYAIGGAAIFLVLAVGSPFALTTLRARNQEQSAHDDRRLAARV